MSSNLAFLTNSHKIIAAKKRAKKAQIKEVLFDDDARREFLTGFHKRKVQKKEAAKQKAIEREKQEHLEARREKRRMLAERAAQNAAEVEKAYGGATEEQSASGDQWSGLSAGTSADKGEERQQKEEYEYEEEVATVTVVEDFDPDALIHGSSGPDKRAEANAQDHPGRPSHTNSGGRQNTSSATSKQKNKAAVGRTKMATKTATKAKDIKYLTNAARKSDRIKQNRRKVEKAERAGGKTSRKSGGGRRKR
ncbi:uncharacterized protein LAESUDRAFT_727736 [Laetiporus sulphureus 93-53]|uniref:Nucleolar protein 12 n=1 Tax=Laetiporus sulphureus 93-53 TaxID=1314785 RepID=A0A165DCQ9_9APHY|nr:uncharacterized protein LAESUDRAFT_727736 [Laetiporus sulphureus 93-53]KZT04575.1 hypothetical protein LAESUDRAFT_727736 [Laetiporus sulphureus 93-53]